MADPVVNKCCCGLRTRLATLLLPGSAASHHPHSRDHGQGEQRASSSRATERPTKFAAFGSHVSILIQDLWIFILYFVLGLPRFHEIQIAITSLIEIDRTSTEQARTRQGPPSCGPTPLRKRPSGSKEDVKDLRSLRDFQGPAPVHSRAVEGYEWCRQMQDLPQRFHRMHQRWSGS